MGKVRKLQFKLTNHFGEVVTIAMEPEGEVYYLQEHETILVTLYGEDNPTVNFKVTEKDSHYVIHIYPEKGEYELEKIIDEDDDDEDEF
ncbi:hypothetical protein LX64_02545 [Chitinophaga skermanii]|uniref:Uncharacterized protein n=1 Tax=Chitinophaga skermanii TaxID=331697 RepID=A0A327QUG9_9BACT|nr:hypothetical protein [Chitinophaga skermanii]RAJ05387.1 hypothetical protein LX64_02545 [Chitinophaga skermanii]